MEDYTLPGELVQNIVSVLNELPARVSRVLLNQMEATCNAQDAARNAPVAVVEEEKA
jgi:hypothetical protein